MKKLLGIVVLGLLLSGNTQSATKEKITIKELRDKGYQLTHTGNRQNAFYLIFQRESEIYSCAGNNSNGYECWHLTDGK